MSDAPIIGAPGPEPLPPLWCPGGGACAREPVVPEVVPARVGDDEVAGARCPRCGRWFATSEWIAVEISIRHGDLDLEKRAERCSLHGPDPRAGCHECDAILAARARDSVLREANRTDAGNAERLIALHGRDLRFCAVGKGWLVWDGKRWRWDETNRVQRLALDTIRATFRLADTLDDKERRTLGGHAWKSENITRLEAMVTIGRALGETPVRMEHLDAHPWLFNAANGTIDLRAGKLRPHAREELLTQLAPTIYDPAAECPLWLKTLNRIFDGRDELVRFVQRLIGYSLTGDTGEQVLALLYGAGANGKSTVLETWRRLLGDYARSASCDTFLASPTQGEARADLARLAGARLVTAVEADAGGRLSESVVKSLTGGDVVTARFLYRDHFEFKPTFKIVLCANHRPRVRGHDPAIWRRIRLVPFTVTIPPEERDPDLTEKIALELPGVLAWAVRGCLAWQAERLGLPEDVREATDRYRTDEDTFGGFVHEKLVDEPGATTPSSELYGAYREWAEAAGERPWSHKAFSLELEQRGHRKTRRSRGVIWIDLRLRWQDEVEPEPSVAM